MASPTGADYAKKAFNRSGLYETLVTVVDGAGNTTVTATRTGRNPLIVTVPSSAVAILVNSPNMQEIHWQKIADACYDIMLSTQPA